MDTAFSLLPSVNFYSQFLLLASEVKKMGFAFFCDGVISALYRSCRLGTFGENLKDGAEGRF